MKRQGKEKKQKEGVKQLEHALGAVVCGVQLVLALTLALESDRALVTHRGECLAGALDRGQGEDEDEGGSEGEGVGRWGWGEGAWGQGQGGMAICVVNSGELSTCWSSRGCGGILLPSGRWEGAEAGHMEWGVMGTYGDGVVNLVKGGWVEVMM